MERGTPTSYMALAEGTPVYSSDQVELGSVKRVLAEFDEDVFDGLILHTANGERFIDASRVGDLYERAAVLTISADEARHLPAPTPNAAAMSADPGDTSERSAGERVGDAVRRAWDRISGNY